MIIDNCLLEDLKIFIFIFLFMLILLNLSKHRIPNIYLTNYTWYKLFFIANL